VQRFSPGHWPLLVIQTLFTAWPYAGLGKAMLGEWGGGMLGWLLVTPDIVTGQKSVDGMK